MDNLVGCSECNRFVGRIVVEISKAKERGFRVPEARRLRTSFIISGLGFRLGVSAEPWVGHG